MYTYLFLTISIFLSDNINLIKKERGGEGLKTICCKNNNECGYRTYVCFRKDIHVTVTGPCVYSVHWPVVWYIWPFTKIATCFVSCCDPAISVGIFDLWQTKFRLTHISVNCLIFVHRCLEKTTGRMDTFFFCVHFFHNFFYRLDREVVQFTSTISYKNISDFVECIIE